MRGKDLGKNARKTASLYLTYRPSAVLLNAGIYLTHQTPGLDQGPDDALIFRLLLVAEGPTDAVFEPALGGHVAADGKRPSQLWHRLKILPVIDPGPARSLSCGG